MLLKHSFCLLFLPIILLTMSCSKNPKVISKEIDAQGRVIARFDAKSGVTQKEIRKALKLDREEYGPARYELVTCKEANGYRNCVYQLMPYCRMNEDDEPDHNVKK